MSISGLFFRDSYFTKKHNENDPNKDNDKEINLTSLNKNPKKKQIANKKSTSSNSSNESNFGNEESELYFAEVETIIPIEDKNNSSAIYNIKIMSSINCNESWVKSYTLDDLIKFRAYLLKYNSSIINLPFPSKSLFRFLPYIGHKYDERNWDILLENKFYLDDYFKTICKDKEMYKLSGFMDFFSKPIVKPNSIMTFYD